MSRIRRTFGKDYKAKVVLEALQEKDTIEVLAKKHDLLPKQILMCKAEATRDLYAVFSAEKTVIVKDQIPTEQLYA